MGRRALARYGSAAPLVTFAVDQLGSKLPDASRRLAEIYLPRADAIAALLAHGAPTLVHGDAHLGNMFADGATPGFLDWAMVSSAPGLRDVAYFLGSSVPTDLRRARERDLVARYCERLREGGVSLHFEAAWDQYRVQLITGWIAAVVTAAMGSHWQPIEVGMAATARADAGSRITASPHCCARDCRDAATAAECRHGPPCLSKAPFPEPVGLTRGGAVRPAS